MTNAFKFYIDEQNNDPLTVNTLVFIIETIGLRPEQVSKIDPDLHLYYGSRPELLQSSSYISIAANKEDCVNPALINGEMAFAKQITFDIVSAIQKFLTDVVHDDFPTSCYDVHGRLNSLQSFQESFGFSDKPLVNYYISYFKKVVEDNLQLSMEPFLPAGYSSVVILSHDVDDPVKYAIVENYKLFPKHVSMRNFPLYHLEAMKKASQLMIKRDRDVNWAFEEVMDYESSHNFKSTFFFAATGRVDQHGSYKYDVPYNLGDKKFRDLFHKMKERGFEIGLHASYNAHEVEGLLDKEKKILEDLSETEVIGNRHHFWKTGKQPLRTFQKLRSTGILYDSSLAFNDAPGYRRNCALPYYPFGRDVSKSDMPLQIPTFLMDSNVMKHPVHSHEKSVDLSIHYINELNRIGGVGAIDWHVRTSYPKNERYREWGKTYCRILDYLATQKNIWVTNFATYYKWYEGRQARLYNNGKGQAS